MKQKKLKIYDWILQLDLKNTKEEISAFLKEYKKIINNSGAKSTVVVYGMKKLQSKKRERNILQLKIRFIGNVQLIEELGDLIKFDDKIVRNLLLIA